MMALAPWSQWWHPQGSSLRTLMEKNKTEGCASIERFIVLRRGSLDSGSDCFHIEMLLSWPHMNVEFQIHREQTFCRDRDSFWQTSDQAATRIRSDRGSFRPAVSSGSFKQNSIPIDWDLWSTSAICEFMSALSLHHVYLGQYFSSCSLSLKWLD